MVGRKCSLRCCGSVGLRCYSLPSDESVRNKWLEWMLKVDGEIPSKKHVLLCERHFCNEVKGLRKLLKGSVPSIIVSDNNENNKQCDVVETQVCNQNNKHDSEVGVPLHKCENIVSTSSCDQPVVKYDCDVQDQVSAIVEIEVFNDFASEPSINRFCSTEETPEEFSCILTINGLNNVIQNDAVCEFIPCEEEGCTDLDNNGNFCSVVTINNETNWLQNDVCDLMVFEEASGTDLDNNGKVCSVATIDDSTNWLQNVDCELMVCEDGGNIDHIDIIDDNDKDDVKLIGSDDMICNDLIGETESVNTSKQRVQRKCIVQGCTNNNTNCRLFSFPKVAKIIDGELTFDEAWLERCEKWIQFCGNYNIFFKEVTQLHKYFYMCSDHFDVGQFTSLEKKQLVKTAVPTLLGPEPLYARIKHPVRNHNNNVAAENVLVENDVILDTTDVNDGERIVRVDQTPELRYYDKLNDLRSARSRKFAKKFEDCVGSFCMKTCSICNEKYMFYPGMKRSHRGKRLCWKFSKKNNMCPGHVPEVLKELSYIEEQLIAKVHPVLTVQKLKGCQYGYKGNVINFLQDVSQFAKKLPHRIEDLTSIVTVRFNNNHGKTTDFRVRAQKIRNALIWLKENNKYYSNIEISEENLAILPEDGNVFEIVSSISLTEEDESDGEISDEECESGDKITETGVPCTNFVSQNDQISAVLDWPSMNADPLSECTVGLIMCAFPSLFPHGDCDLREDRPKEIKMHEYFKHFLCYHDGRFAKHRTFRFFAFNLWMRHTALTDGNVFVNKDHELAKMNVGQLKEHIKENPNVMKKLMFMGSNLRGSKSYWKSRCGELKDMVEQLGLPTVFLTMSAADMYWPDLFRLLSGKDVSDISMFQRRKLIQENPLIVDMFFEHRLQCYIDHVLVPKYEVVDHWYRIEYQHRGSPHVHGLFWFKGAPNVSNYQTGSDDEKREINKYFDELVTAVNPCPESPVPDKDVCEIFFRDVVNVDVDLSQLLKKVQKHKHGSYCERTDSKTKKKYCRFKFPLNVEPECRMEVNSETSELEFFPERNDNFLNKFNPFIISTWRANIDIAPVVSKRALIEYLVKYVSKSEVSSTTFKEICENVCGSVNSTDKAKRAIHKILMKSCVARDISAQEVCHILMGSKLFSAGGRDFVVVYTNSNDWVPLCFNASDNPDSTERVKSSSKSFMLKYATRPESLHSLCLWDVAKLYNVTRWKKVKKPNIVRVFPRLKLTNVPEKNEEYYRQKVLLFVPWNTEFLLKEDGETWKDVFTRLDVARLEVSKLDLNLADNIQNDDLYEEEDIDNELGNITNEDWMIAARLSRQRKEATEVELGLREHDVNHDWTQYVKKYETFGDLNFFRNFIENEKKKASGGNIQMCEMPNVTFSEEQSAVKSLMERQIAVLRGLDSSCVPKSALVQGKAGTGKSLLIRYLVEKLHKDFGPDSYLLLGPTGVSAVNIGGSTIHSVLKIPCKGEFNPLKGENSRKFCDKIEKVKFVIIDEYSMIGCSMLSKIDRRLREGTGVNTPFGGLNIYLFGDFKQLPPVKDCAVYDMPDYEDGQHGKNVFDSIEARFVLNKGHRQNDPVFEELLDRLSVGDVDMNDYNILKERFDINVGSEVHSEFEDAIRLFSTKEKVANYNKCKLHRLKDDKGNLVPIARVRGLHHGKGASHCPSDAAGGLESTLYLARGARIMLRSNLWVEQGLVNGAVGTVCDLLYYNGEPSVQPPSILMCKFDNYRGPGIGPENLVPIGPMLKSWIYYGTNCSRQQFPIVVCYACSIHKSQGLTLEKAVIDVGDREFSLGLTYVALSRVKKLNGILLKSFSYRRLKVIRESNEMELRKTFAGSFG